MDEESANDLKPFVPSLDIVKLMLETAAFADGAAAEHTSMPMLIVLQLFLGTVSLLSPEFPLPAGFFPPEADECDAEGINPGMESASFTTSSRL